MEIIHKAKNRSFTQKIKIEVKHKNNNNNKVRSKHKKCSSVAAESLKMCVDKVKATKRPTYTHTHK